MCHARYTLQLSHTSSAVVTDYRERGEEGRMRKTFPLCWETTPCVHTKGTIPTWPRFDSGYVSVLLTVCRLPLNKV